MRSIWGVLFTVCLILPLVSCGEDNEVTEDDIIGEWEVFAASRNGKPTDLITGATFEIGDEGQMSTDLTGSEVSGPYEFVEDQLHHMTGEQLIYTVKQTNPDTLTLRVDIRGLDFVLRMARAEAE